VGYIVLNGGSPGAFISAIKVAGVDILSGSVPYNGTIAQTVLDIYTNMDAHISVPDYVSSAGAPTSIGIAGSPGSGSAPNGRVLTISPSGMGASVSGPMAGGVNAVPGGTYSVQLVTINNTGTVDYLITSGALPAGLSLSITGLISGVCTETTAATFTFEVSATDDNMTIYRTFTIDTIA